MLKIKGGSIEQLAKAIEATGIVPKHQRPHLVQKLRNLVAGRERFGEVDLGNAQQVELVAYRVRRNVNAWPRRPRKSLDHYPLVIVGAGSTAAYYLDTLGPAHDKRGTLVIGGENPWIRQRGHAIPFINHTQRQIALPSQNVTAYGGNESFVNRRTFGYRTTNRVRQLAGCVVNDSVVRISRARGALKLECNDRRNGPFYAERVVFVAGSGKERAPEDEQLPEHNHARVIHMNTFIRDIAWRRKGSVVIWGSNAAIDAVAAAKRWGWNIKAWLVGGDPAWLPGTRYKSRPYRLQDSQIVKYENSKNLRIEDDGRLVKVSELGRKDVGDKLIASRVDYVVYGISSLDLLQEVLDESVLGEDKLAPILDTQGVFSDPRQPSNAHHLDVNKAFLGWGTQDHQLQVFGLAAENYEYDTSGPRAKRIALTDARVMALKQWLSGDVLTVGQLSYIRSALSAVNHFVPGSIEHRVDFSHSNANQLRIHLATKYPFIPEMLARWFVGMLGEVRFTGKPEATPQGKIAIERLPHGFTVKQERIIERYLTELNTLGKRHRVAIDQLDEVAEERHLEENPLTDEQRIDELIRLNPRFRAVPIALRRELVAAAPRAGGEVRQALAKIPRGQR